MQTQPYDYDKLKALLEEQESFPTQYLHKVIGLNTSDFDQEIARLERQFERLSRESHRVSANGNHIAHTLVLQAHSADEIVQLMVASQECKDLLMML